MMMQVCTFSLLYISKYVVRQYGRRHETEDGARGWIGEKGGEEEEGPVTVRTLLISIFVPLSVRKKKRGGQERDSPVSVVSNPESPLFFPFVWVDRSVAAWLPGRRAHHPSHP